MPITEPIISEAWHGLDCLRIQTRHSVAIIALHGGQLLSWVPYGQRDVFWRSGIMQAPPAALRGGVPVCWPWFGSQGPAGSPSHGFARTSRWGLSQLHDCSPDSVRLTLRPRADSDAARVTGLSLSLTIHVADTLTQTLVTRNNGPTPYSLTQALHSCLAVGDATLLSIDGITDATYYDNLQSPDKLVQTAPFQPDTACDRVYHGVSGAYHLNDPVWRRRIAIESSGCQSLVVWNPGPNAARPSRT